MRLVKINGDVLRYRRRRYGLSVVMKGIQNIVMSQFYVQWQEKDEQTRKEFLKKIERVIQRELLGKQLLRALVRDLIAEEIKVDSATLRYLKTRLYKGDLKRMLADFQTIREDELAEFRREKFRRN